MGRTWGATKKSRRIGGRTQRRTLGRETIPATVLPLMPEEMLRAERDENAARLDLRPSEMAALGMRLEKIEKRKDAERLPEVRRKAGLKRQGQLDGEPPSSSKGPVRDRVGSVLGLGWTLTVVNLHRVERPWPQPRSDKICAPEWTRLDAWSALPRRCARATHQPRGGQSVLAPYV